MDETGPVDGRTEPVRKLGRRTRCQPCRFSDCVAPAPRKRTRRSEEVEFEDGSTTTIPPPADQTIDDLQASWHEPVTESSHIPATVYMKVEGGTGTILPADQTVYEIVEGGSQRGGQLLVDNHGYSYTKKCGGSAKHTVWRCSIRAHSKGNSCKAAVKQVGSDFIWGRVCHTHAPRKRTRKSEAHVTFEDGATAIEPPADRTIDELRASWLPEPATESSHIPADTEHITFGEDTILPADQTVYEIVEGGSQRGGQLLVDNHGYSYTRKYGRSATHTVWRCSIRARSKGNSCKATVKQVGDSFTRGRMRHTHAGQPGIVTKVKLKVHRLTKENVFQTAASLVGEVMAVDFAADLPSSIPPDPDNLDMVGNEPVGWRIDEPMRKLGRRTQCQPRRYSDCGAPTKRTRRSEEVEFEDGAAMQPPADRTIDDLQASWLPEPATERSHIPVDTVYMKVEEVDALYVKVEDGTTTIQPPADQTIDDLQASWYEPVTESSHIPADAGYVTFEGSAGTILPADQTVYEIVEGGSQRGGQLLVDNHGYSYTRKCGGSATHTVWRCSIRARSKGNSCKATVKQVGDSFTRGRMRHTHAGQPGIVTKVKLAKQVNGITYANAFKSTASIVEEVMAEELAVDMPPSIRPKPANLARRVNYRRQKNRLAGPTCLDFAQDEDTSVQQDLNNKDGACDHSLATPEPPQPGLVPQQPDGQSSDVSGVSSAKARGMAAAYPCHTQLTPPSDVVYEVMEGGTQRGGLLLVDNRGYSYTRKCGGSAKHTVWRCSIRSRSNHSNSCKATVKQTGERFTQGRIAHSHAGQPGIATKVKLTKHVYGLTKTNFFKSAASIVKEVMAEELAVDMPSSIRLNPASLARCANYQRKKYRAAGPTILDFVLDRGSAACLGEEVARSKYQTRSTYQRQKHQAADPSSSMDLVPDKDHHAPDGFLQQDVIKDGARNLIFATPKQLELLRRVKQLFLCGTFNLVNQPFQQLFSFHAFLCDDEGRNVKQVPLTFVLMSSRRKRDYVAVFRAMKNLAPNLEKVHLVTRANWQAAAKLLPDAVTQGCDFRWIPALWRQVQQLGLAVAYLSSGAVRDYTTLLFTRPGISADHIVATFDKVAASANNQLRPVMDYIRNFWIVDQWKPEQGFVYKRCLGTNDRVEGWHDRLDQKTQRCNLQLCLLLQLLRTEANLIPLQQQQPVRKQCRLVQGRLAKLWKAYQKKEMTVSQLLRRVSDLTFFDTLIIS